MLKGVRFSFDSVRCQYIEAVNTSAFVSTAKLRQKFDQFRAEKHAGLFLILKQAGSPYMGYEIRPLSMMAPYPASYYIDGLRARGQQVIIGLNLLSPLSLEQQFSYARYHDTIHLGKFVINPYITLPLGAIQPAVIHHADGRHQLAPSQIRGIVMGGVT